MPMYERADQPSAHSYISMPMVPMDEHLTIGMWWYMMSVADEYVQLYAPLNKGRRSKDSSSFVEPENFFMLVQ